MKNAHLRNEYAEKLRALAVTTTETGSKLLDDALELQVKLISREARETALVRTISRNMSENVRLRAALEEILRLEKAAPNTEIRLMAELALRDHAISHNQDVDT